MLAESFLLNFKRRTEDHWLGTSINPAVYGFQFQPGTRWNAGLSVEEIDDYESLLDVHFPVDFRALLKVINGTDTPTLNVYGNSGEPSRQSVGVYSYPSDLEQVRRRIADVRSYRDHLVSTMQEQGFALFPEDRLVPIYIHRYLVCTPDRASSVVLSIVGGTDAVVYGNSLQEYLEIEFLTATQPHHKW